MILGAADARLNGPGADDLLVDLQILHGCFHHLHLIGIIVDREVAVNSPRAWISRRSNAHAEGMECRNQRIARTRALQQIPDAELHLVGGLVRECYGEDGIRPNADAFDKMHDAIGNNTRLSAAGAGQDEYRPFSGVYGFELLRVEKSAEIHSSFYRNTLREVTRLINVASPANSKVIGEQLKRNHFQDRQQVLIR